MRTYDKDVIRLHALDMLHTTLPLSIKTAFFNLYVKETGISAANLNHILNSVSVEIKVLKNYIQIVDVVIHKVMKETKNKTMFLHEFH